jgi:hypothetical protein
MSHHSCGWNKGSEHNSLLKGSLCRDKDVDYVKKNKKYLQRPSVKLIKRVIAVCSMIDFPVILER